VTSANFRKQEDYACLPITQEPEIKGNLGDTIIYRVLVQHWILSRASYTPILLERPTLKRTTEEFTCIARFPHGCPKDAYFILEYLSHLVLFRS